MPRPIVTAPVPNPIAADTPELRLFAQLAGVAPSRMAVAFNDLKNPYEHITLEELELLFQPTRHLVELEQLLAFARMDV